MQKRTILDQIEVREDGIQLRFGKQIIDGEAVLANDWHRAVLDRDLGIDEQLLVVSEHLNALGYPSIAEGDISRVKQFAAVAGRNAS